MKKLWPLFESFSTKARLGALLLLAMIPFSVLSVYSAMDRYQLLMENARVHTQHLAQMGAENQNEVVSSTRQLLAALANDPSIKARDWPRCNQMLKTFWRQFNGVYSTFNVADSNGDVVCSGADMPEPVNIADRRDFQDALASGRFVMGDAVNIHTAGLPALNGRYPVLDSQGKVYAVMTAQIPISEFAGNAALIPLHEGGELMIADHSGNIIIQKPQSGDWMGKPVPDDALRQAMLTRRYGVIEAQGADGVPRIYGFSDSDSAASEGLHVAIGIPRDALKQDLKLNLLKSIAVILTVFGLVFGLAWLGVEALVVKKVRILVETVRKIRDGDNTARTGLCHGKDELSRVACAVDETAAELERVLGLLRQQTADLETDNTELHKQLLQSEKMAAIGQLAAGVAHEINNPVGFVNSNLAALRRYITDMLDLLSAYEKNEHEMSEAARTALSEHKQRVELDYLRADAFDLLDESMEGLERVKQIVMDLKNFSHADQPDRQWANLEAGLDSTLNIVWNELKYNAEVIKEYGGIGNIQCYASQLNQVFMNLLVNAAHAIGKHGQIYVRTGEDDRSVWVEVEDTGGGIAPEHLSRIFEPFFTTKPVGKGTGLGLSLSYGIVEKHGGRIEVKSELGKGAVFKVVLPKNPPIESIGDEGGL